MPTLQCNSSKEGGHRTGRGQETNGDDGWRDKGGDDGGRSQEKARSRRSQLRTQSPRPMVELRKGGAIEMPLMTPWGRAMETETQVKLRRGGARVTPQAWRATVELMAYVIKAEAGNQKTEVELE